MIFLIEINRRLIALTVEDLNSIFPLKKFRVHKQTSNLLGELVSLASYKRSVVLNLTLSFIFFFGCHMSRLSWMILMNALTVMTSVINFRNERIDAYGVEVWAV